MMPFAVASMYTDMVYIGLKPVASASHWDNLPQERTTPWKLDEFLNSKTKVKPMAKRVLPDRGSLANNVCVCALGLNPL